MSVQHWLHCLDLHVPRKTLTQVIYIRRYSHKISLSSILKLIIHFRNTFIFFNILILIFIGLRYVLPMNSFWTFSIRHSTLQCNIHETHSNISGEFPIPPRNLFDMMMSYSTSVIS